MKSCRDVHDDSNALIARALPLRTTLQVGLHLLMCGDCRRFVRDLRRLLATVQARWREDPPSEAFVERVMQAARHAEPNHPSRDDP